jgi:DNA-binding response OmpR family regulator
MKVNFIKKIFCGLVFFVVFAIGILTISNENEYSVYEARTLTKFPKFNITNFFNDNIYQVYTDAFSDQLIGKNILVKLFFLVNPHKYFGDIALGKDGQLYPNPLVVEDDTELNKTVCSFLNHSGYEATGCLNANDAYDAMYDTMFDLIISDIMMPVVDGFEFARNVRELNQEIPILFMTARDDIASKQRGFRIGVDDYMVKPIDLDELFLRIGALLRRAKIASSRKLEIGNFVMDADEHTAYLGDEEISLTNREFSILYKLLSYPKKTFTRMQLMDEFWDADSDTAPRAVDVYMTKLRSKLSDCQDFEIKTVHGLGYKAVIK